MTTSNEGVYTYNWDTAFAIPIPDVNQTIVDQKSSPPGFTVTAADAYTVSANFCDWQICQGGDGKNVRFSIPMTGIVVDYSNGQRVTCETGTAVIEINLHYIPHDAAGDVPSNPVALVVKTTSDDPSTPVAALVGQVTLSPDPGTVTSAVFGQALLDWVNGNLGAFNHIFSVVDLNRMIDQQQWGFVTPNYTSYAYLDGSTLEDSVLGVLTMTGDRNGESLSEQISPSAIPGGSEAGFLVSQERTLYDLVRPAIMVAYPGLTDDNFLMSDDKTRLYLVQGVSVDMPPIAHDGSTYYPKLTALTVETDGETFTVTSTTSTYITFGVTSETTATNWYTLDLGTSNNGQTITFIQTQPTDQQYAVHQDPGVIVTEIILSIIIGLVSLICAPLTDGASIVLGGLVIGLLLGASQIATAAIESVNKDTSPAVDLLMVNAVDPIKWTGSGSFKLDYVHPNISLQLGGDPLFV
ncbi:TULIP family P47-like protein [Pseudomonas guariconensis]|uniref:TULIP family P47-like protein n=1 Tax=Pseudomonas TaxID=286 RepID=UPI001CE47E71|nr:MULTISPECIES: TULIP family P47-like protein [Pseudomonas]MCO7515178.1 TULIP family P47-like protein [Pseudomonas putida]MCO7605055.1 TULIP family P47-like protein [Pseudomonas guariconensis]MCO7631269.1 TULIP family P47-like protein [Pseudomonas guariconensis]